MKTQYARAPAECEGCCFWGIAPVQVLLLVRLVEALWMPHSNSSCSSVYRSRSFGSQLLRLEHTVFKLH